MVDVLSEEYTASAREKVLARVRAALEKNPISEVEVPRDYIRTSESKPGAPEVIEVFVDALEDYKAKVIKVKNEGEVPAAIKKFLGELQKVVVPEGIKQEWLSQIQDRQINVDKYGDESFSNHELDAMDAVITASRCAVSHTGTIILDGTPDQGRRAISLVPDTHIVVVHASTVYPTVPQAVEVLKEYPERATTWIAGPSATSDIELIRVDGVHGPRNLFVVIVLEA